MIEFTSIEIIIQRLYYFHLDDKVNDFLQKKLSFTKEGVTFVLATHRILVPSDFKSVFNLFVIQLRNSYFL